MAQNQKFRKKENINIYKGNEALHYYLMSGCKPYLQRTLETQHTRIIADMKRHLNITNAADFVQCSCSLKTLKPTHVHVNGKCPFGQGRRCFCLGKRTRWPCPAGFCSSMHDKLLSQHRSYSPNFKNTNIGLWRTNPLQIGLANIPSKVHNKNITSLNDVDPAGMLQILINDMEATNEPKLLELLEKIKQSRDEFTHSPTMALEDNKLHSLLDNIVESLDLIPRCAETDEAKRNVLKLKDEVLEITTIVPSDDNQNMLEKGDCRPQDVKACNNEETNQPQLPMAGLGKHSEDLNETIQSSEECDIRQRLKQSYEIRLSSVEKKIALKDFLLKRHKARKFLWEKENGISVDDMFVPQRIMIKEKNDMKVESRRKMTYKEMFYQEDRRAKNIHLIGQDGFEKSLLLKHFTSVWCRVHAEEDVQRNHSELEVILLNFDYLFYISLFDEKQESNVHDMITLQLSEDNAHIAAFEQIMELESDKCLILLDSVNEFGVGRENVPILDESKGYTVITSTKPWKTEMIKPEDKIIEFVGTCMLSPFTFVRKTVTTLNMETGNDKDFMDFLMNFGLMKCTQSKPSILMSQIRTWHSEES